MSSKGKKNAGKGGKATGNERTPLQPTEEQIAFQNQEEEPLQFADSELPINTPIPWDPQFENPDKLDFSKIEHADSPFLDSQDDEFLSKWLSDFELKALSEYSDENNISDQFVSGRTVYAFKTNRSVDILSIGKHPVTQILAAIFQSVVKLNRQLSKLEENDFKFPPLWSLIYPQNSETNIPIISSNGIYAVKFYFAGQLCTVIVNDKIPIAPDSGSLIFPNIHKSNGLWTHILSKALLKLLTLTNRSTKDHGFSMLANLINITPKKGLFQNSAADIFRCNVAVTGFEGCEDSNAPHNYGLGFSSTALTPNVFSLIFCNPNQWNIQNISDVWSDQSVGYTADKTMIVSKESTPTAVIVHITTLSKSGNDSIQIHRYNPTHNIKQCIVADQTYNGFATVRVTLDPQIPYFISVASPCGYHLNLYSQSNDILTSLRSESTPLWDTLGWSRIECAVPYSAKLAHQTCVIFNIHLKVENAFCKAISTVTMADIELWSQLQLQLVDLDSGTASNVPCCDCATLNLSPNQNGYSLIGYCNPLQSSIHSGQCSVQFMYDTQSECVLQANVIDLPSVSRYHIDYQTNSELLCLNDTIEGASFVFAAIQFTTLDNQSCAKTVTFSSNSDKDTTSEDSQQCKALHYCKKPSLLIPSLYLNNESVTLRIQLDRNNTHPSLNVNKAIQCSILFISDSDISLTPNHTNATQFAQIKQEWYKEKNRAEQSKQTRGKYIEKIQDTDYQPKSQPCIHSIAEMPQIIDSDASFWESEKERQSESSTKCKEWIENAANIREKDITSIESQISTIEKYQSTNVDCVTEFARLNVEKRSKQRSDRIEWNQLLTDMDTINEYLSSQTQKFSAAIEKVKSETVVTAKKKKKGKPLVIETPDFVTVSIQKIKAVTETVPNWRYDDSTDKMAIAIAESILSNITSIAPFIRSTQQTDTEEQYSEEALQKCCEMAVAIRSQLSDFQSAVKEIVNVDDTRDTIDGICVTIEQNINFAILSQSFSTLTSVFGLLQQSDESENNGETETDPIEALENELSKLSLQNDNTQISVDEIGVIDLSEEFQTKISDILTYISKCKTENSDANVDEESQKKEE